MIRVNDASGNAAGYPVGGNTIGYDINGNMVNHLDKGISNIAYNYLNYRAVLQLLWGIQIMYTVQMGLR